MTNDVGDDMLNSLLEVQRTMSAELLQVARKQYKQQILEKIFVISCCFC
jgi:hypothetical protein